MKKILFVLIALILSAGALRADEGMWIPLLIEKLNIGEMQEKGFKLTAEDIYSVNKASMKDAVMIFGGGCTAELVSDKGLILTNFHCGRGSIQRLSSLEHDYLKDGFWAMSQEDELANRGLTVKFLKRMEDVTEAVLAGASPDSLAEKAVKGTHYTAQVKPFFAGNQYFLFVEETYKDIRLVGAPPSSIGNFGGDTDNWMWPRHTGDFSVFRIYADKDNKPAEYSADNKPYKPAHYFPVSLKGYEQGDFTMVFGYPGSTYQYVHSNHLKMLKEYTYPKLIDIRTEKLNIIKAAQAGSQKVRIQYTSKQNRLSNSWKRWRGEIRGLEKMNAIEKKMEFEEGFLEWATAELDRKKKYGSLMKDYNKLYSQFSEYNLANSMMGETYFRYGAELVSFSGSFRNIIELFKADLADEARDEARILKGRTESFFKDYDRPTDEKLFTCVLEMYDKNIDHKFHPSFYFGLTEREKEDYSLYTNKVYAKTKFSDKDFLLSFLEKPSKKKAVKLAEDPVFKIYKSAVGMYEDKVYPEYKRLNEERKKLDKLYMEAIMEYEKDKVLYPDANFTLRLSYGAVQGYKARDAVQYNYYTTLDGVIQKLDPNIFDYNIPQKLIDLYDSKDFGDYTQAGKIPVAFVATNHTTGGNSGSPVLNAEGHLIGINFDRAWEGVMSDLAYNPNQCRNISVDIRYVLFLIDKLGGASYLLEEMEIVR